MNLALSILFIIVVAIPIILAIVGILVCIVLKFRKIDPVASALKE